MPRAKIKIFRFDRGIDFQPIKNKLIDELNRQYILYAEKIKLKDLEDVLFIC